MTGWICSFLQGFPSTVIVTGPPHSGQNRTLSIMAQSVHTCPHTVQVYSRSTGGGP